jgi:CheY-like chemotaxis protein
LKVLIADDDTVHTFLLEMFLKKWGYEVTSTDNGAEALQMLRAENSPCIAILDWQMPRLTGDEVCREVKDSLPDSSIFVIMLTANAQLKNRQQATAAGVDAFMTKPYEPEELKEKLREASQLLESKR